MNEGKPWRPENWENGWGAQREEDGMFSKAEIFEAGADAMLEALPAELRERADRVLHMMQNWQNNTGTAQNTDTWREWGRDSQAYLIVADALDAIRGVARTTHKEKCPYPKQPCTCYQEEA